MTVRNLFFRYFQPFGCITLLFSSSYPCFAQDSHVVRLTQRPEFNTIDPEPIKSFASGVVVTLPSNQTVVISALHPVNEEKVAEKFSVDFPGEGVNNIASQDRYKQPQQVLKSSTSDFVVLLFSDSESIKKYSVSQDFNTRLNVDDSVQVIGYNPTPQVQIQPVDASITGINRSECMEQNRYEGDSDINYLQLERDGTLLFRPGMSGGGVFDSQSRWVGIHLGVCDRDQAGFGKQGFAVSTETIFRLINQEDQFNNIRFNDIISQPNDPLPVNPENQVNDTNTIIQPNESLSDFLETEVSPDLKQPIGGQW